MSFFNFGPSPTKSSDASNAGDGHGDFNMFGGGAAETGSFFGGGNIEPVDSSSGAFFNVGPGPAGAGGFMLGSTGSGTRQQEDASPSNVKNGLPGISPPPPAKIIKSDPSQSQALSSTTNTWGAQPPNATAPPAPSPTSSWGPPSTSSTGGPSPSPAWGPPPTSSTGGPSPTSSWGPPPTSSIGGPSPSPAWGPPPTSSTGGPSPSPAWGAPPQQTDTRSHQGAQSYGHGHNLQQGRPACEAPSFTNQIPAAHTHSTSTESHHYQPPPASSQAVSDCSAQSSALREKAADEFKKDEDDEMSAEVVLKDMIGMQKQQLYELVPRMKRSEEMSKQILTSASLVLKDVTNYGEKLTVTKQLYCSRLSQVSSCLRMIPKTEK